MRLTADPDALAASGRVLRHVGLELADAAARLQASGAVAAAFDGPMRPAAGAATRDWAAALHRLADGWDSLGTALDTVAVVYEEVDRS